MTKKNEIIGTEVTGVHNGTEIKGRIVGRLLEFPLFVSETIRVEISWDLAARAANGTKIII